MQRHGSDDMSEAAQTTIGAIVASDVRTARIFEEYGIDYCCGGRRSLADACRETGVDADAVAVALAALPPQSDFGSNPTRWPLDRLVDHIVETNHAYVRAAMPRIARQLAKVVELHAARHPELSSAAESFGALQQELPQHLLKEERILFPYVRALVAASAGAPRPSMPFGTIENPIRMMEREHRDAVDELNLLRQVTDGFAVPEDCATYRSCFAELAQFERDLRRHIHLENNVLFPRAIALEEGHRTR